MIEDVQKLVDNYWSWLKDKTILKQVDDWVEISAPFLDRNNDYIQIYTKKENSGYILTDDANTIHELEMSGCDLNTPNRKSLLNMTLNGFGVGLDGDALTVKTSQSEFPRKKHNLLQAILAVNDLFYTSRPITLNLFLEDVSNWLRENEIRVIPNIKLTGKSGYDHLFEFAIPASRKAPERLLKVISSPQKSQAQNVAFTWIDTREVRTPETKAYSILNDIEVTPSRGVIEALSNYDIEPLLWNDRDRYIEILVA